jgi:hypothetical protein
LPGSLPGLACNSQQQQQQQQSGVLLPKGSSTTPPVLSNSSLCAPFGSTPQQQRPQQQQQQPHPHSQQQQEQQQLQKDKQVVDPRLVARLRFDLGGCVVGIQEEDEAWTEQAMLQRDRLRQVGLEAAVSFVCVCIYIYVCLWVVKKNAWVVSLCTGYNWDYVSSCCVQLMQHCPVF